ncbi:MAG: tRNA 2-thiouridine(34) synthase MnmA [Dokdonella sp.]|uniref:tRNA 2-thiouridine(34) synthase MnmA n=1 Tax=Dokdonella sp. TaxID=2291710 RepID=UPI003F7E3D94
MRARTIVGMSGGVDSSVAALMLQRSGESIAGLFMQNWEEDERRGPCRADEDRRDAVAVSAKLGIPLYLRNFADEYWDQVFEHFLAEYRRGRTPNPDVLCNREIKFKTFLDHAQALGAERIATGHYARVDCVDGRWRLLRARDTGKDQTYFLHALGQHALAATVFPLGDLEKSEVRTLAREAGLATHDKKDSTGICFIGERDFRSFLAEYIPARPGPMRTPDGTTVGEHAGVFYYTLGQRSGLGIGGRRGAEGEPWYVIGKDVVDNVLYVAQGHANHWLQSHRLAASAPTWVAGTAPATSFRCTAMTRYRQAPEPCSVELDARGCTVAFDAPQRAVTPGQSVVFYDGEACLGGAVIECSDAPYGGWEARDA